jgi:hypothetical protein
VMKEKDEFLTKRRAVVLVDLVGTHKKGSVVVAEPFDQFCSS